MSLNNHLHVKKGDTVVVLSGKDKGQQGKIIEAQPKKGKVIVDGIEAGKRHAEMLREIFIVSEEFRLPEVSLKNYVSLISPFYPRFSHEILNK